MRKHHHPNRLILIAALIAALCTSTAWAKPKKAAQKGAKKTDETTQPAQSEEYLALIADLKSNDPEKVVFAVQMLGATGNPDAVNHLIALLKTGPRNDITNMALETLGALANPAAVDTLLKYLNHRRSDARVAAIFALEGYTSPQIKPALEQKLRDSDPQVRASAAVALGTHGDTESVSLLFQAFDRGVNDAVISIGRLGSGEDAIRLTEYLGRLDIMVLLPGFKEFMGNPRVDEATQLKLLNILFDLAGPEVRKFALQIRAKLQAEQPEISADNAVFRMLNKMVTQIAQE